MANKVLRIPKNDLPPVESDNVYSVRFRVVSEDKNRTSHWSPVFVIESTTPVAVNGEVVVSGPIVIANPGGEATRGSFVQAFDEFYGSYFTEVHLKAIRFYQYFANPKVFEKYFASATKGGASSKGRKAALSWIMNAPGGNNGNL